MAGEHFTLQDWLAYLETLHPKTIALGLERVAQVKQRLGLNPSFPIIVVGGTNGKGSVCAMLEAMLHAAGYRVGCYTSPHLLDYNERVRIAKRQVSDADLCAAFEKIEQARKGQGAGDDTPIPTPTIPLKGRGQSAESVAVPLTYFEFGTLAAMQCFIDQAVEVAILEVGLGGRLDAVNVFDHDCAVVASVDMDHMEYLGNTREQIAFEKAGIFRRGKVAVFGDLDMPATIAVEAQRIGAQLWRLVESPLELDVHSKQPHPHPSPPPEREGSRLLTLQGGGRDGGGVNQQTSTEKQFSFTAGAQQWNYRGMAGTRSALPYPALRGAFQLRNASAALAALDTLKDKLPVSMAAVRRGLVEVGLPGRFQVVPGKPMLILDVAHNPHAARSLAQNLVDMKSKAKTFAVFAMLKDKDMAGVAHALKEQVDVWLVAGIAAERGATAAELAQVLHSAGVRGEVRTFATVTDALHHACNEATENDRIAAFGSFYTVAEVMRARGLRYA